MNPLYPDGRCEACGNGLTRYEPGDPANTDLYCPIFGCSKYRITVEGETPEEAAMAAFNAGEPEPELHDFTFYGELSRSAIVLTSATDFDTALAKVEAGEYLVQDEQNDAVFEWDGTCEDEDGTAHGTRPAEVHDTRSGLQTVSAVVLKLEELRATDDTYDDQMARDVFLDSVGASDFDEAELTLLRDLADLI